MDIRLTKGGKSDRVEITRTDGLSSAFDFPHKGPVPHDAIHYFVERGWPFTRGFWGMVAAGHQPGEIGSIAKAAGHASAKRAVPPDPAVFELIQAERIVECFEVDLWGLGGNDDDLLATARRACEASYVPMPAVADGDVGSIRGAIAEFARLWTEGPLGHSAVLRWDD